MVFTKDELETVWRWSNSHNEIEWYKNFAQKLRKIINRYDADNQNEDNDLVR